MAESGRWASQIAYLDVAMLTLTKVVMTSPLLRTDLDELRYARDAIAAVMQRLETPPEPPQPPGPPPAGDQAQPDAP